MASVNANFDLPQQNLTAPHGAVLDLLVPGFSLLATFIHTYTGIDLTLYLPVLITACGMVWSWSYLVREVKAQLKQHFVSSIRINSDDEVYNMLMIWIIRQKFSHNCRNVIANTRIMSTSCYARSFSDFDSDDDDDDEPRIEKPRKWLHYTPLYGDHYFWYKYHLMVLSRVETQSTARSTTSERDTIYVSCLGRSPRPLKNLLMEARQNYIKGDKSKTVIYRGTSDGANDARWKRCMARIPRPLSTIILDEATKKLLVDDIAHYLKPATWNWYSHRGIPYRRGYLLHGPPGTGKSSLSVALAGFFKMRIYILSLSSSFATESNVTELFDDLPKHCVVLLEDVDSAGLTHTREDQSKPKEVSRGNLSLSGLLNILDGVASQEGRVLIMTTNHIETLDKALIRPGRIDMTVHFGRADQTMAAAIFSAIYKVNDGESGKVSCTQAKESRDIKPKDVDALAEVFASRIPELEFSPAEIQGLLLRYKDSPTAAVENTEAWVTHNRRKHPQKMEQRGEQGDEAEIDNHEGKNKDGDKAQEKAAAQVVDHSASSKHPQENKDLEARDGESET